ncbi:MAG: magnesium transporter CorA family protein [Candidatus Pacebacteria bacterium]|nr:magnesium transporter CorA family protein [Candidatus Paceibacterota bacterium]
MQIIKSNNLTWIDIKGPTQTDLEHLKNSFDLHPLVLKEILPQIDYPKIENYGEYLFIVFFYPFFDRETSSTIPFELDIIVGKNFLITNHYRDIVPLSALFHECNLYPEKMEKFSDEGTGELLYRTINEILQACFPKISHIKQNVDAIEKIIFNKENKKAIDKIADVKRDIIGFERILEPQKLVLQNLIKECQLYFPKKLLPYFHNLLNLYEQVKSLLETNEKTLLSLESTNQSLIDTKTNEIMKILTLFSVIVFPLTLLAALFGMNTKILPLVGMPYDFWIVIGIMLFGAFAMVVGFKIKKWF